MKENTSSSNQKLIWLISNMELDIQLTISQQYGIVWWKNEQWLICTSLGYMYQSWAARKFCWSRTGLGTLVKTPNWHLSSSLLYCFVPELQFISNGYSFVQPVTVLLLITSHSNISNSPTTIFLWMKWTRKKKPMD